jgi:hypothetical protein
MLQLSLVKVKLISNATGRSVEMPDRTFGKLLHLAQFNHWNAEKVEESWPSGSWNTEVILCHAYPYLPGDVSDSDARDLAGALQRCLAAQSSDLEEDLYLKAMVLFQLAKQGGFEVQVLADEAPVPSVTSSALSFLR